LAKVNAKVRFLSCEPLLSAIDLTKWLDVIDWVIVGGESGGGSREMFEAWARDIRDQADGSAVFFMKQMGAVWAKNNGLVWPNKGENMEDFPADLRIREFPG
jgi:protein gp37